MYVGSRNQTLYALDATTGDALWQKETDDWILAGPAVADGTVYAGTDAGTLYAFDAATGDDQWTFQTKYGGIRGAPTVTNGTVYLGSRDTRLYAVDAATGEKQWAFQTRDTRRSVVLTSPTVVDGTVYVGNGDRVVTAVNAITGDEQWQTGIDGRVYADATVADGTVYVGDHTGLHALDADNGDEQWLYETSSRVNGVSRVVDDRIYLGLNGNDNTSNGGGIHAVDLSSAEATKQWTVTTDYGINAKPVVDGETVTVATTSGQVSGLSTADGDTQWTAELETASRPTPLSLTTRCTSGQTAGRCTRFVPRSSPSAVSDRESPRASLLKTASHPYAPTAGAATRPRILCRPW